MIKAATAGAAQKSEKKLRDLLLVSETVLWSGAPKRLSLSPFEYYVVGFSILWLTFSLFIVLIGVLGQTDGVYRMTVNGVPREMNAIEYFSIVAIFPIVGVAILFGIFARISIRLGSYYCITDHRAIIIKPRLGRGKASSLFWGKIASIERIGDDQIGSIYFHLVRPESSRMLWAMFRNQFPYSFSGIENPRATEKLAVSLNVEGVTS